MRCAFCQNWTLSQCPKDYLPKRIDTGLQSIEEPVCPQLFALDRVIPGEPTTPVADTPPTPLAKLRRAREIGLEAGLRYVYEGNILVRAARTPIATDAGRY